MFESTYKGRKTFITGHTGFKGSWLSLWMDLLGARLTGYSLPPPTDPNHYDLINLRIESFIGDINNREMLSDALRQTKPSIVFHLAAQPSVLYSYTNPLETFKTNILGTANLLEICRQIESIRAIIIITTDKCYKNEEWEWGYRENDELGGHDPYSSSKACVELIVSSYRKSYFPLEEYGASHRILLSTARAGNVIGGGDWTEDRLVPDVMRSAAKGQKAIIRNKDHIRPWQHLLDPICGYLLLGKQLIEGRKEFSGPWNFGPDDADSIDVLSVVKELSNSWSELSYKFDNSNEKQRETKMLKLDASKAKSRLGWKPVWKGKEVFSKTVEWYQAYYTSKESLSKDQLKKYIQDANESYDYVR